MKTTYIQWSILYWILNYTTTLCFFTAKLHQEKPSLSGCNGVSFSLILKSIPFFSLIIIIYNFQGSDSQALNFPLSCSNFIFLSPLPVLHLFAVHVWISSSESENCTWSLLDFLKGMLGIVILHILQCNVLVFFFTCCSIWD